MIVNSKHTSYPCLLVTAAIAIATHDDARDDSDVAQTPAATVLPHVGQGVRAPDAHGVVGFGEGDR